MDEPLLRLRGVVAGYGVTQVLQGVDVDVEEGGAVAVLGRNGAGKTTLVHSVLGIVRPRGGSIRFDGHELVGRPSHRIARLGIGLVPQGRRIFTGLTVEENLRIAERDNAGEWTVERVYELLPALRERRRHRGDQLSGGEQQMLAIGRALVGNPRLLLLDEPSEGLAPMAVAQISDLLSGLRARGASALLVEQNLRVALELADSVCIMARGQIVYQATVSEFRQNPDVARSLLGVS